MLRRYLKYIASHHKSPLILVYFACFLSILSVFFMCSIIHIKITATAIYFANTLQFVVKIRELLAILCCCCLFDEGEKEGIEHYWACSVLSSACFCHQILSLWSGIMLSFEVLSIWTEFSLVGHEKRATYKALYNCMKITVWSLSITNK